MAGRHWLDPLARRLLVAAGQLPPPPAPPPPVAQPAAGERTTGHDEVVERELLALRLAHDPQRRFRDGAEVRRAAALGWTLAVHAAGADAWLRLPGCPPAAVDRLLALRRQGQRWQGPDDLAQALGLPPEQVRLWLPVLRFAPVGLAGAEDPERGEGPPPLAINQASERLLRERLGLGPQRCRLLLRERARRPFRDLADLEERLQLPPELVERWIGRFRYGSVPGPVLPPAPRPRP